MRALKMASYTESASDPLPGHSEVLKTGVRCKTYPGFESLSLRHFPASGR